MNINEIMQNRHYIERGKTLNNGEIIDIEFFNPINRLTVVYYPKLEMYEFVSATKVGGFRFESGKFGNIEVDEFFHKIERMYYKYVEVLRKLDEE